MQDHPHRPKASLALLATAGLVASCALRPSAVAADAEHMVMIKSVRIPVRSWLPWYTRWAEHVWVDLRRDGTWHRIEWNDVTEILTDELTETAAFADERWQRDVAVHQVFTGAEARDLAARITAVGTRYPCAERYRAWPGPNSNSFVEWLARECDMATVLPPTAIGKDFTTWLHVGVTTSGTGLEIETLPVGLQVGLREGIELHVIGLSLGAGIWPPRIVLPFLPAIPGGWFAP